MGDRGIEGQPTGAGAKAGIQTSVNSPAIREAAPVKGPEVRAVSKPELSVSTRNSFDSGPDSAERILEGAKRDGIHNTLENLAAGTSLEEDKPEKDTKVLAQRGEIVDFNKKPTTEKPRTEPERRPDEEIARAQKAEQEMEELRRELERLREENERLNQQLKETQEELRGTTRTGIDTEETISKIVSLKQRRAENAGRYMEILQEKALRQAA